MIITFLGTSAANAYPEAFCRCHNCKRARTMGGRSLRRRSAALINDDLLIDLGPDIMTASFSLGRPLTRVRYCLQTHGHDDHLDPSHLLSRTPGFGVVGAPRLHFFASPATLQRTAQLLRKDVAPASLLDPQVGQHLNLQIHEIQAMRPFQIGRYQVVAFPANHDPSVDPLLYAVTEGRYSIFYGTDTAALLEETWIGFHRFGLRFDVLVLDHTYGPDEEGTDHLDARRFVQHIERLHDERLLADGARVLATHIAHAGNHPHPELSDFASHHGYEVAYDGLTV